MNRDIKKLEKWLNKKGYTLEKGKSDSIIFDDKIVKINFNKNVEHILFSLLHECGHLVLFKDREYHEEFFKLNTDKKKTNQYFYELLKEELYAWEKGIKLAKKLNIKIDKISYKKYSSKFFLEYVKHVNVLKKKHI
jgi:Zn-dependent peptidase ImmA (M78 family)